MAYNLMYPVTIFNGDSMAVSQTSSIVCTATPLLFQRSKLIHKIIFVFNSIGLELQQELSQFKSHLIETR